MISSKPLNEKKQLSFIYQPGIGLYDKKGKNLESNLNDSSNVDENLDLTISVKRKSNFDDYMNKNLSTTTTTTMPDTPSQGLLLCPKDDDDDSEKKIKKKKISSTSTALLDDDSFVDSILFNELQSVQQQWQQFLLLTMEKELHIQPSDAKKKSKSSKFHRTNEFLLAYENLYNFDGMKHWCPILR